jgi:hypothetical protein
VIIADGNLGSAEAEQGRPATEEGEFDAIARLAVTNESPTRPCNLPPVAITQRPGAVRCERDYWAHGAYPLLGDDRAVGVTPLERLEPLRHVHDRPVYLLSFVVE